MDLKCDLSVVCNALLQDSVSAEALWHSSKHGPIRELIKQCVRHLILEKRKDAAKAWENSLSEICSKIEKKLYFKAASIEEYSDPYTLITRMQAIIDELLISCGELKNSFTIVENPVEGAGSSKKIGSEGHVSMETALASDRSINNVSISTKEPRAYDSVTVGSVLFPQMHQVSSQGCSRVFIIKVLTLIAEHVKGKSLPSVFTFKRELIQKWLVDGKAECCKPSFIAEESFYGGPPFLESDCSTHWTDAGQLYTWWKNNVERKAKFKVLMDDAQYSGPDTRRVQRAKWCQVVVALADAIRASSNNGQSRSTQIANEIEAQAAAAAAAPAKVPPPPVGFRGKVDPPVIVPYMGVTAEELMKQNEGLYNRGGLTSVYPSRLQPLSTQFTSYSPFVVSGAANPYLPDNMRHVSATIFQGMNPVGVLQGMSGSASSSTDKQENVFLYILFDLLMAGDTAASVEWTEDGASFKIKNEGAFVESVLTKHFQCLPTLQSFQEYLLSFGFVSAASPEVFSHVHFKKGRRDLVSEIHASSSAKPPSQSALTGLVGVSASASSTPSVQAVPVAQIAAPSVPLTAAQLPMTGVPTSMPSMHDNIWLDPQTGLLNPFQFPYLNTLNGGFPSAAGYPGASSLPYNPFLGAGGMGNPLTPFQLNPPPYSSYVSSAGYLPPYGTPAFNRFNLGKRFPNSLPNMGPNLSMPNFLGMQPYGPPMMGINQMQQYLYQQQQQLFPNMASSRPSFPPRITKDYNGLKSRKVLASAAAAVAAANGVSSSAQANQSAEQFLDMTHAERLKRAYTKRSRQDIAQQKEAKAQARQEKQEKRREREAKALAAKSSKRGRKRKSASSGAASSGDEAEKDGRRRPRSRRQRRKPQKLRDMEDIESDSLESESEPDLADEADEDSRGDEKSDDEEEENDDDDREQETSNNGRPRRTRTKMLLKNSDKLRVIPVKKKSRSSRSVPEPAKKPEVISTKNLQSKESSADGTIMAYRASYVTGSKHRSERSSNNNLYKYFSNGEWNNYDRVKPKLGEDCQVAIPDLQPRPNAQQCSVANENLAWTSRGYGGLSTIKAQKALDEALNKINDYRSTKPLKKGTVTVVKIQDDSKVTHKLCCILKVLGDAEGDVNSNNSNDVDDEEDANTTSLSRSSASGDGRKVKVYDGLKVLDVNLSDCYCFHARHEDTTMQYLHEHQKLPVKLDEVISNDEPIDMGTWSGDEVKTFCSGIKRWGDNVYRIWNHYFREDKSFQEVVDFFNRIYPHVQGNKKKLINIFHRAELVSAGLPTGLLSDEVEDDNEEEEEEEDNEEEEEEDSEGEAGAGGGSDGDSSGGSDAGSSVGSDGGDAKEDDEEDGSGTSSESEAGGEGRGSESGDHSTDMQMASKPRRGRPPKNSHAIESLVSHSLLDHAKKMGVNEDVAGRSSNRKRSLNSNVFDSDFEVRDLKKGGMGSFQPRRSNAKKQEEDDEAAEVRQDLPLFCICRTIETENERYIACSVGHPDRCNGWVHLSCAGMSPTISEEILQDITDYICPLCAADEADKKPNRGRKSLNEKLQQIEAFTSPVYNFAQEAPAKGSSSSRSARSNNRRRSY